MAGDGLGVGGGVELEVLRVVSLLGGLGIVLGHGGRGRREVCHRRRLGDRA